MFFNLAPPLANGFDPQGQMIIARIEQVKHLTHAPQQMCEIMPTLKDIREFLEMGWFPAVVGLIAYAIVLAADYFKVPYLSGLPTFVLNVAAVGVVVCFSIVSANLIRLPIAGFNWFRRKLLIKRNRELIKKALAEVNDAEGYALAYLITTNQRVFSAPFDDPLCNALRYKRLIIMQSGAHMAHEWPFAVSNAAWEQMQSDLKKWLITDQHGELPNPFRRF